MQQSHRRIRLLKIFQVLLVIILGLVFFRALTLLFAYAEPADTLLVLGGTPFRERYAAELVKQNPRLKVLISGGSADPCIWLMFKKAGAPMQNVWMEHRANNTLENFVYSTPILVHWGVKKVLLVTDQSQDSRALPMSGIILGAHGIATELALVPGSGGEKSHYPLWSLLAASLAWALVSEVWEVPGQNVTHLAEVDMKYWYHTGFYCAQQAEVPSSKGVKY